MRKNSLATRLAQSLSFEVEASPQENVVEFRNAKNMTPVNVKIRVRKREDGPSLRNGFISVPNIDEPGTIPQKIRLASSDHTILSFNMVMEADYVPRTPDRKSKRSFFGFCLGTHGDDDDSQYMPSTTNDMNSISDTRILRSKSPLSKNADIISTSSSKKHKKLFGRCKPGGCLDPPLDEDKYIYKPILSPATPKQIEQTKIDQQKKTEKDKVDDKGASPNKKRESKTDNNAIHLKEEICEPNGGKDQKRKKTYLSNENYIDQRMKNKNRESNDSFIDKRTKNKRDSNTTVDSDSIITYPPTSSDGIILIDDNIRRNSSKKSSSPPKVNKYQKEYYIPMAKIPTESKKRASDTSDRKYSGMSPNESKIKTQNRTNESSNRRVSDYKTTEILEKTENQTDSTPKAKKNSSGIISGLIYNDKNTTAQKFEGIDDNLLPEKKPGDSSIIKMENIIPINIPLEKYEYRDKDVILAKNKTNETSPSTKNNIIPTDGPTKKCEDVDMYLVFPPAQRLPDSSSINKKIINTEKCDDLDKDFVTPSEIRTHDSSPSKTKSIPTEKFDDLTKDFIIPPENKSRDSSPSKNKITSTDSPAEKSDSKVTDAIIPKENKSRDTSPTKKIISTGRSVEKTENIDNDIILSSENIFRDSSLSNNTILSTDIPAIKSDSKVTDAIIPPENKSRDTSPTKKIISTSSSVEKSENIYKEFIISSENRSRDSSSSKKKIPNDIHADKIEGVDKEFKIPRTKSRDSYLTGEKLIAIDTTGRTDDMTKDNTQNYDTDKKSVNWTANANNLRSKDFPGLLHFDDYTKIANQDPQDNDTAIAREQYPRDIETVFIAPNATEDAQSEKSDVTPKESVAATIELDLENCDVDILIQSPNEIGILSRPEINVEISHKKGDSNNILLKDGQNKAIGEKKEIPIETEDIFDYEENVSFIQDSSDAQQDTSYIQDSSDAQKDGLSDKSVNSDDTVTAVNIAEFDGVGFEEEKENKLENKNYKLSEDDLQKDYKFLDENENLRDNDAVFISNLESIHNKPYKEDHTILKNRIWEDEGLNKEDNKDQKYSTKVQEPETDNQQNIISTKNIEIAKDRDDHSLSSRDERKSLKRSPIIGIAISPTEQVVKEVKEKLLQSITGSHHNENIAIKPFERKKHSDIIFIDDAWNKNPKQGDQVSGKIKDSIFLNLAFQTYLKENQLVVKTLDGSNESDSQNVTLVRSLVTSSNKIITVPIDPDHTMTIEIKPSSQSERRSKIPKPISKQETDISGNVCGGTLNDISGSLQLILSSIYDQDLVPLQEIIKELKIDINQLADQQIKLREKLGPGPKRLQPQIHTTLKSTSPRCPCLKKF